MVSVGQRQQGFSTLSAVARPSTSITEGKLCGMIGGLVRQGHTADAGIAR